MKFFRPEEIDYDAICGENPKEAVIKICDYFNAKLERESKHVWSVSKRIWDSFNHPEDMNVYEGLLVNVKTVKENCTHPVEKVGGIYQSGGMPEFYCLCGARMKPKEFEEVK